MAVRRLVPLLDRGGAETVAASESPEAEEESP